MLFSNMIYTSCFGFSEMFFCVWRRETEMKMQDLILFSVLFVSFSVI